MDEEKALRIIQAVIGIVFLFCLMMFRRQKKAMKSQEDLQVLAKKLIDLTSLLPPHPEPMKTVAQVRPPVAIPVIDLPECPPRAEDKFWDWMGVAMRDAGRDDPRVLGSSSSAVDPRLLRGSSSAAANVSIQIPVTRNSPTLGVGSPIGGGGGVPLPSIQALKPEKTSFLTRILDRFYEAEDRVSWIILFVVVGVVGFGLLHQLLTKG